MAFTPLGEYNYSEFQRKVFRHMQRQLDIGVPHTRGDEPPSILFAAYS
jgi:hypothetical protein